MKANIAEIERVSLREVADVTDMAGLQGLRLKYLGRKGVVTALLREVSQQPPESRAQWGKSCNELKNRIETALEERSSVILASGASASLLKQAIDVTLPGRTLPRGGIHPIVKVSNEICTIFTSMGFSIADGPEVETDSYNFSSLNIPKDHSSRDMQDTFYVTDDVVLRTHTSPVQIRVMEGTNPPLRIISPGRVYRPDWDITHSPMFHQIEGFVVDIGVTFGDLKGVLLLFLQKIFGEDTILRFRPSFFPFTEPSAEVDIQCGICHGSGCRSCSHSGWLEILGCGMIDPAVFANVGYDYDKFSGFAFGVGVERVVMLKYGVSDIRHFFENDVRFLEQF
ncbi:MAG: phenylalanine--tRNA ligase subunit alpha [Deltaproteobacteria bacterium]|nr:phenylalanine--tRNA ligase subunit alpha [Deltaproteobacteria bacterium]